jgi:hypothetical protein
VDQHRLGQRIVNPCAMVPKHLPQHLLGLGCVEMGRWRAGVILPCFGRVTTMSEAGRAERDVEASASCAERCDVTQPSPRITTTGSGD